MGRTKGDGTRLLLSTAARKAKRLKSSDWAAVEKTFGKKVPKAAKEQIEKANTNFLRALRDSEQTNTILLSEVQPIIASWTKKNALLARRIGLAQSVADREVTRKDLIRRYREKEPREGLKRRPPLSLLAYAVETNVIAAAVVEKEIASLSADVSRHPWILWVGLLAEILKQHGLSTSAHSWIKTTQNPKFVQFITLMQHFLGGTYPRSTEESLIDGVKKAKSAWKTFKAGDLLSTLRKWGRE